MDKAHHNGLATYANTGMIGMKINVKVGTVEKEAAEVLVFYLFEDVKIMGKSLAYCNTALHNSISELIKEKEVYCQA